MYHDEGTLALRKLEDLLPEKSTRPTVGTNTYPMVPSHLAQMIKGLYRPYSLTPPTTASPTRLYFETQLLPQSSGLFCAAA